MQQILYGVSAAVWSERDAACAWQACIASDTCCHRFCGIFVRIARRAVRPVGRNVKGIAGVQRELSWVDPRVL